MAATRAAPASCFILCCIASPNTSVDEADPGSPCRFLPIESIAEFRSTDRHQICIAACCRRVHADRALGQQTLERVVFVAARERARRDTLHRHDRTRTLRDFLDEREQ